MINAYTVRRVLQVVPQLFILTVIAFGIINLAPGDPSSMIGGDQVAGFLLTTEQLQAMRKYYGLDRPFHEQYFTWFKRVVKFDFGRSFADGRPVTERILDRLPPTLLLTGTSMLISLTAIPLGVVAGYMRNTMFDHIITLQAFLGVALPSFWFAIIAIMIFGAWLGWLPVAGMTEPGEPTTVWSVMRHLALPAAVLARIHRRRASGQCPEAARGCSCESGIMVLKQQSRPQNKEHPIDATTQPSRSHPNRV